MKNSEAESIFSKLSILTFQHNVIILDVIHFLTFCLATIVSIITAYLRLEGKKSLQMGPEEAKSLDASELERQSLISE